MSFSLFSSDLTLFKVCTAIYDDDDDDCFYIVLFSALDQTHCARV